MLLFSVHAASRRGVRETLVQGFSPSAGSLLARAFFSSGPELPLSVQREPYIYMLSFVQ